MSAAESPTRRRRTQASVAVVVALAVAVALGAWSLRDRVAGGRDLSEQGAVTPFGAAPADRTPACAGRPAEAPRELRGMWITTVNNIDWPSRRGLSPEAARSEFRGWLDLAVRQHHNAVFVHVRPSGDALWPSAYAPWSEWLTGAATAATRAGTRWSSWSPRRTPATWSSTPGSTRTGAGSRPRGRRPAGPAPADHPLRRHRDWVVTYPSADARQPPVLQPRHPRGAHARRGRRCWRWSSGTTSTACTSTTSSTRTRRPGRTSRTTRRSPRTAGGSPTSTPGGGTT